MSYDGVVKIYRNLTGTSSDVEITSWVDINSINITAGRQTVTEQPSPSTASFIVYSTSTDSPVPLDLNEQVRIMSFGTIDSTYGSCWFIGRVSDVSVSVSKWGNGQGLVGTTYTLVGDLSALNRKLVGASGYPKQYDANRIVSILTDCNLNNSLLPIGVTYEIAAHSHSATNALALAQEAANSAKGVLYERSLLYSGSWSTYITYDTALTRLSNPIYELSNDEINASGFSVSASMTECATVVRVNNYAGNGTTYTAATSITNEYGFQYGTRDTKLHNATDAQTIGQELLAAKQTPKYRIGSLSINLASPGITSGTLGIMLPPVLGTRLAFTVPAPLNDPGLIPVKYEGFIEGYSVQFSRGQILVTLNLSNFGDLYPYTYWSTAETSTTTWATAYTNLTKWENVI